jgi:hypothetical protein
MNFPQTFLLGAQLLIPASEEVPNLNVASSCRAAAAIQIADSQSFGDCMNDENEARAQLVKDWLTFSAPNRVSCTADASSEGIASYVELLVCLQTARGGLPALTLLKGARKRK